VGFNRRFAPLARCLKEFVQECYEPLFCSYRVNAGYLPPDHWTQDPEQGGGRLVGEACHFIDFITYLVGESPSSISAQALPDLGKYHQDNFLLACEFPDGSLGAVSYLANGDRSFSKERLEVFCGGRTRECWTTFAASSWFPAWRRSHRSLLRQG
jgi:predicted dehydrogenase